MELCSEVKQNKTKKRRRVELKKIDSKAALEVSFSKRRKGLFNKAAELSVLCGARIAIVAFSPHGNPHVFGHPSADAIIDQYLGQVTTTTPPSSASAANTNTGAFADQRNQCSQAVRDLDSMKRVREDSGYWWERSVEGLGLEELRHHIDCMEKLKVKVNNRLEVMKGEEDRSYFDTLSPIIEVEGLKETGDFNLDPTSFDPIQETVVAENDGFDPTREGLMLLDGYEFNLSSFCAEF